MKDAKEKEKKSALHCKKEVSPQKVQKKIALPQRAYSPLRQAIWLSIIRKQINVSPI